MKKSIILFFIFISSLAYSQWNSEFDYFSLKFGATNSIFSPQPDLLVNKMVLASNGIDHLQAFPDTGFHFNYAPGYYGAFLYNHDLRNDNVGLSIGLEYKMYGITANYYTNPHYAYTLREIHKVSQITVPAFIKFGKKFYEPQKYIYFGASYSYNIFAVKTEKVSYIQEVRNTKLDKAVMRKSNIAGILGFNYMFFNIEANYVFGNFLSNSYQVEMPDGSNMLPYAVQPKGTFLIKTGLTFPLNSWTSRKWYAIESWLRRILK